MRGKPHRKSTQIRFAGTRAAAKGLYTPINIMRADIDRSYNIAVHIKKDAQITLDLYGIDGFPKSCRELMDLMRSQPAIKRIDLEYIPRTPGRFLLCRRERIEVSPKTFRSSESHSLDGGTSRITRSISTVRPSSWSSTPDQNDSGTSGCCKRRRILSISFRSSASSCGSAAAITSARALDGRRLTSSITCSAVIPLLNRPNPGLSTGTTWNSSLPCNAAQEVMHV